jgi:ATP-dependent DNA helicase DinG
VQDYAKKIYSILGPGGILARSILGYEHREQQIVMALEVFKALESDDRLIIEAPTGTGKTLAYLIAAALCRKRVAISTGTKNLQEQLFYKDVPFVKKVIFRGLKTALLKGRGNFVCHSQFRRFLRQPHLLVSNNNNFAEEILNWYRATRKTGQGDRAELENLPDDNNIWPEICSNTETCLGKRCPDKDECFVNKMRARALESDLMIVNHHLLASDLAIRESGFGEVIPRYEALIIDEAHGLEDAATQHFGFHMSFFKLARFIRDTRSELKESKVDEEKFQKALNAVEERGRGLFGLFSEIGPLGERIESVDPETIETRNLICENLDRLAAMVRNLSHVSEELRTVARRAHEMSFELRTILSDEPTGDYACWAERRDRNVMLHASPVDIGPMVRSRLYEKVPAVVFTSATLSSGGNFDYFKSRLGLDDEFPASEFILDSPFDYARQTMLYIPKSIPEPNSPGFTDAMATNVTEILKRTSGRAFVLFTSYRNMEAVHRKVDGSVPFPLLIQGSKPKTHLLREFRENPGSVLFATASFWEGVDVQGEALSCVIIDRLPFASPNDPIVSARLAKLRKQNMEPFYSFQVPMAVIALKQGLGRLIRTRSDRGVLCILDSRILTKPYGRIFLRSLYSSPLYRDPRDIETFFSQKDDSTEAVAEEQ